MGGSIVADRSCILVNKSSYHQRNCLTIAMALATLVRLLSLAAASALLLPRPSSRPHASTSRNGLTALRACEAEKLAATLSFREADPPEQCVPRVALTRSRDGSTGTATFRFDEATVLQINNIWENGVATGLWLSDTEGQLHTSDLSLRFDRGKPVELVFARGAHGSEMAIFHWFGMGGSGRQRLLKAVRRHVRKVPGSDRKVPRSSWQVQRGTAMTPRYLICLRRALRRAGGNPGAQEQGGVGALHAVHGALRRSERDELQCE